MTIDEIKELIKIDETRTVELKKTTGELKDAMHSVCAMLNSDGGHVIIGGPGCKLGPTSALGVMLSEIRPIFFRVSFVYVISLSKRRCFFCCCWLFFFFLKKSS